MEVVSQKVVISAVFLFLSLFYWGFNFIILYHLLRFGVGTQPKRIAAVFLLSLVTLSFVCVLLFANIDTTNLKHRLTQISEKIINRNTQ